MIHVSYRSQGRSQGPRASGKTVRPEENCVVISLQRMAASHTRVCVFFYLCTCQRLAVGGLGDFTRTLPVKCHKTETQTHNCFHLIHIVCWSFSLHPRRVKIKRHNERGWACRAQSQKCPSLRDGRVHRVGEQNTPNQAKDVQYEPLLLLVHQWSASGLGNRPKALWAT